MTVYSARQGEGTNTTENDHIYYRQKQNSFQKPSRGRVLVKKMSGKFESSRIMYIDHSGIFVFCIPTGRFADIQAVEQNTYILYIYSFPYIFVSCILLQGFWVFRTS